MRTLHYHETDAEIQTIRTRALKCDEKPDDILSIMEKEVFQVIKDHNNGLYRKWLRNPTSFVLQNTLPRLSKT